MSHFTNVKTEIRDMEALENALKSMDLNMEHNAECRHYYGTTIKENVAKKLVDIVNYKFKTIGDKVLQEV